MRHHFGRDVEIRRDQLAAHRQPALLLRSAKKRQTLIDTPQCRRTGHDAVFAPDPVFETPLGKLACKGFGMNHRHVLPTPVFAVGEIAVANKEVVEIEQ